MEATIHIVEYQACMYCKDQYDVAHIIIHLMTVYPNFYALRLIVLPH